VSGRQLSHGGWYRVKRRAGVYFPPPYPWPSPSKWAHEHFVDWNTTYKSEEKVSDAQTLHVPTYCSDHQWAPLGRFHHYPPFELAPLLYVYCLVQKYCILTTFRKTRARFSQIMRPEMRSGYTYSFLTTVFMSCCKKILPQWWLKLWMLVVWFGNITYSIPPWCCVAFLEFTAYIRIF